MENGGNKDKTDCVPRVRGSEVFVGGLQRTVTEQMIREVFGKCGDIVEIRMMKDQNDVPKGFCFVRFTTREAALKAQNEKNNMILQGKKIGVAPSTDQDILFLGNLRKEWSQEELESMVRQAFQDVESVELGKPPSTGESSSGKKRLNRGFAFVHFGTHAAASRAYRVANRPDFLLGGKWHPAIDWASNDPEPDPEEMAKVKIAFVGNLPANVKDDFLRKLFEPFGELERVAISRKSNTHVGFVHFKNRSGLDVAIKELDTKVVDGPDKGPKFKLQVSVAKPADKSKKRGREEFQKLEMLKVGAQVKGAAVGAGALGQYSVLSDPHAEYVEAKFPRLTSNLYGMAEAPGPYEIAVLALPTNVTEKLLQIFRHGLVSQREVHVNVLESLRELPEATALAVLDKFAGSNFAVIRNKGAFLATMVNRSRKDLREKGGQRPFASAESGRNMQVVARDNGLLSVGASHHSLLDSYIVPHVTTNVDVLGYGSRPSVGAPPTLSGAVPSEYFLSRVPSVMGDIHTLPTYRAAATASSLGATIGTPTTNVVERRTVKFDPFTGEPYKFDPFTGERLQPTTGPSSHLAGKYY